MQMIEWNRELPVTPEDRALATKLMATIRPEPSFLPDLLAPEAKRGELERRLGRAYGSYGHCELEQPLWNNGKGEAAFRLRCAQGAPELHFRSDPQSARLLDFSVAPARRFGDVCSE